jgi:dTDP-4-dehydrorhamnose reductase
MADQRWLLTGASGQLGGHLLAALLKEVPPVDILALAGQGTVAGAGVAVQRIDLADPVGVHACVAAFRPACILHVGGVTAVSDAYSDPARAEHVNVGGTRALAEAAAVCGARLVFASTDMVFDGGQAPYAEEHAPAPLSQYGRSKAAAEQVLAGLDRALIVRLPLMYGFSRTHRVSTFAGQIDALRRGQTLRLFTDEFRTPVWLGDAAAAMLALARSERTGVIHVAGPERLSRYEMVERVARVLGIENASLTPISRLAIDAPEPRPEDLSLDGRRFKAAFPHVIPGPIRRAALGE